MEQQNAENQPGPSSQCELFPWKLVPVDLDRSVEKRAEIRASSSSQKPGPIPPAPRSLPRSILEVELPDESYAMMKTMLSQLDLQDENMTSFAADAGNRSKAPSPTPKPASAEKPSSPVQNAATKKSRQSSANVRNAAERTPLAENASTKLVSPSPMPGPRPSKIGTKDEPRFIQLVREHPHLYDIKDPSYRDKEEKKKSWAAIGEIFGMADDDCQTKWKSLREKYNREMKQFLVDEDRLSNKTMQFLKNMSFICCHKRIATKRKNISEDCKSPESAAAKRKRFDSASGSVPDPTSPAAILREFKKKFGTPPCLDTQTSVQELKTLSESAANIDQLFADTIALELQRFPPKLKNFLKAKIWQVFAEFGNPM